MLTQTVTRKTGWLLAAALIALFAAPLFAQTNQAVREIRLIKASRLIGLKIEDRDGEEIGKLRDLVLDLQGGRVKYAVVASGGFLGVRSRLRAVPPHLLSAATAKRNTLALNLAGANWDVAPTFRLFEYPSLARTDRSRAIDEFYKQATAESAAPASVPTNAPLAQTGRDALSDFPESDSKQLKLASNLVGAVIRNRAQDRLGEILDLLVVFDEHAPVFVILQGGGRLTRDRERRYAVPLRALTPGASGGWTLDVDRDALPRAVDFDGRIFVPDEKVGKPELFRYNEKK
jgi:sporulation protein YlmC with PRC-barrel domain